MQCLIDHSITTAVFSHPIQQGWVERADQFALLRQLHAERVAERARPALVGSIEALSLLDRFVVVTDVALVSWHTGDIALRTPTRPDEVEDVPVALNGVSRTAEAVARATIHHFYGITVNAWERDRDDGEAVIVEGAGALRLTEQEQEQGHLGDLVRAWFILSGFPLATHVLVAPRDMAESDPDAITQVVEDLHQVASIANERRRELRRNLAEEHGLDRERLLAFQDEQTAALSKTARKGWLDLVRRVSRQMKLPPTDALEFVTVGTERE